MAYTNSPLVTYTNLTKNKNSPRNQAIDRITIHCIVGQWTAKKGCDYFATTDRQCSSNYVVGKDGSIGLSVEEKDRSWCSSSGANDHRAITIETASDTTHPYAVTDAAYNALIQLCADICKRNGKTKLLWFADKDKTLNYKPAANEMVMTVHQWFANKACPGEYLYQRHGDIADKVNAILNPQKEEVKIVYRVQVGAYSKKENAEAMLKKIKAAGFDGFIAAETVTTTTTTTTQPAQTAQPTTPAQPAKKSNEEIAKEVIRGNWGNGADRKKRLEAAGYNYSEIQSLVNKMLK